MERTLGLYIVYEAQVEAAKTAQTLNYSVLSLISDKEAAQSAQLETLGCLNQVQHYL